MFNKPIVNLIKSSQDLVKDIKSEVSGNFEDLLCGLLMKPREYDAYCLYDAMAGAGTTESVRDFRGFLDTVAWKFFELF